MAVRNLIVPALMLAAPIVTSAQITTQVTQGGRAVDVMALDIAGVSLNMTPEQAVAAVKAKGFVVGNWVTGPSFAQMVQTAVNVRDPKRPGPSYASQITKRELWLKGPSGETMHVFFRPMPDGARVSEVAIGIDTNRTAQSTFEQQVMTKYGRPTQYQLQNNTFYWCGTAGRQCGDNWLTGRYPYMDYTSYPAPALRLTHKNDLNARIKDGVSAEVERLAPKGGAAL